MAGRRAEDMLCGALLQWSKGPIMKFDPQVIRLLGRLTDRMDSIRKNPHRYEVPPAVAHEIEEYARRLETQLAKVTTVKAG